MTELQKLTATELQGRLHDAVQQMMEAEGGLSAVYRELDRRRGKFETIAENKRSSPYDFEYVKWRAAKVIARVIEDGLSEEIPVEEHNAAVALLERYGASAAALAVVVTITGYMMGAGQRATPPFHYKGEGGRQCH